MSESAAVTFYYEGELPAHHSFGAGDGALEEFEITRQFKLADPGHIAEAMRLVELGILSRSAPKKG